MKKLLLFGAAGMVGSNFIANFNYKFKIVAPDIQELDLTNASQTEKYIKMVSPEVIINYAALTNVEKMEEEKGNRDGLAFKVNALAVRDLSKICKKLNVRLIQISTEYVFDGTKEDFPYTEEDVPNPINWYGETKYWGERFLQQSECNFTIVRISMPFTSQYELKSDVARFFLGQLRDKQQVRAIVDQKITPVLVDDISGSLAKIVEGDIEGIIHVAPIDFTTPFEFAKKIAQTFNLDESLVQEVTFEQFIKGRKAPLLRNSWLSSQKFRDRYGQDSLHTIEESLKIFQQQLTS